MNRLLSVIAVIASSGVFLQSAPVPKQPEPPKLYFPLAVGTKWATVSGEKERFFAVTSAENRKDKYVVEVGLTDPKRASAYHHGTLHVSQGGVRLLDKDCDDGPVLVPLLKVPFQKGDTWKHSHNLAKSELRWEFVIAGEETVSVAAGKFEAVRVDCVEHVDGKLRASSSTWYAVGVGIVKYVSPSATGGAGQEMSVGHLIELKSFTLPDTAKRDK